MAQVIFDGERELIIVNPGVTSLDVRTEIYSEWKRWFLQGDNSKFSLAMDIVGGNPLPDEQLGLTYFLLNGWKIRPFEGDHRLRISGNLYKADGEDPIEDTVGDFKVTVSMRVSNLVDMVGTSGTVTSGGSGGTCDANIDPDLLDSISGQEEWTITAS
jgi:hypothetical protein